MQLNDTVQSLIDAGDWGGLAAYYAGAFHLPSIAVDPLALLWVAQLCLTIVLIRRLLRPKPRIPWPLGKLTIDLRGGHDTLHTIVSGISGVGKSTAVQILLLTFRGPAVVVAFDNSRPIRKLFEAMGWTIWTPGGSLGWNIVDGPAQVVSEALTSGFDKTESDTGYNSSLAGLRIWRALERMDADGIARDIWLIIAALKKKTGNADEDRACLTWANRLETLAMSLGPSLGNDFTLIEALKHGDKILILPNYFISPRVAPLVGGIALVYVRWAAEVVGNFLIVVEEANQSKRRRTELVPVWTAGRDRGCPAIAIAQDETKLPDEVVQNTSVHIVFAQEEDHAVRSAVTRMRGVAEPDDFYRENLPTGHAWVRSPEHSPQRIRIPLPRLPKRSYAVEPTLVPAASPTGPTRRIIVREINTTPDYPSLPLPSLEVQELLEKIDHSQGDCWLWLGLIDEDGYGLQRWAYADEPDKPKNNRPAHQVIWEVVNGRPFPRDSKGRRKEWDHRRTCPRHCVNPHHGTPVPKRVNVQNMHRTRGHKTVGAAAD